MSVNRAANVGKSLKCTGMRFLSRLQRMEINEDEIIEVDSPEFEPLLLSIPIHRIIHNRAAAIGAGLLSGFVFIFLLVESILLHHTQAVNNSNLQIANSVSITPIVKTTLGELKGVLQTSGQGRNYSAFYNVPYAEPPVGELRFKTPVTAKAWNRLRDATKPGPSCVQVRSGSVYGNEDCLYLNVFTPNITSPGKLPVIVYLHGTSFDSGDANDLSSANFMDEEVVLVAVQYRLGVLGFLNMQDEAALGNQGLKDQVLALKWVQKNIEPFGGNSSRVALLGEGSGAFAAHVLLKSPAAKGHFSGVIAMSGNICSEDFDKEPSLTAMQLGKTLNCPNWNDSVQLVTCLRSIPVNILALHQSSNFLPSQEKYSDLSIVLFNLTVLELQYQCQTSRIPFLLGVSSSEWLSKKYVPDEYRLKNDWLTYASELLDFGLDEDPTDTAAIEALEKIRKFYFTENTFNSTNPFLDMISDRFYAQSAEHAAIFQSHCGPSYLLFANHELSLGSTSEFGSLNSKAYSKRLIQVWVSFATFGVPMIEDQNGQIRKIKGMSASRRKSGSGWFTWDTEEDINAMNSLIQRLELWFTFPLQLIYHRLF